MRYQYTILDDDEIERIHSAALQILADVGMKVLDDGLCALLRRQGLIVDPDQRLVRYPPQVVRAALASAPASFRVRDHLGRETVIKNGNTLPAVYGNAIKVWDWHTRSVRPSTLEDLVACVRLADAIPEIRVVCPVCLPGDVAPEAQAITAISTTLQSSSKSSRSSPQNAQEARFWTEAVAVADQALPGSDAAGLVFGISPTSPLKIDPDTCGVLKHGAEKAVPLFISPCPVAGMTSPITMAGTAVQTHAEFLGMLTICQLLHEGLPVVYGGSAGPMDPRTGALSYGSPERNTMLCANIDIANHFGLPHSSAAGSVDSAWPDFQAGASKALAWLTRLMKGTIFGLWFGSLLTGSTVAPEQIVLDADLYRAVLSMLQGMIVDDERMAYDAIRQVGPDRNYLMDEHTLAWLHSDEYYMSPIANLQGEGGKDMLDRAHDEVERILARHQPSVPEPVRHDLQQWGQKQARWPAF